MVKRTGEPSALFGLEVEAAVAVVESWGCAWSLVRSDDPRGRRDGPDVVLAGRRRPDGGVELVVTATLAAPGGAA